MVSTMYAVLLPVLHIKSLWQHVSKEVTVTVLNPVISKQRVQYSMDCMDLLYHNIPVTCYRKRWISMQFLIWSDCNVIGYVTKVLQFILKGSQGNYRRITMFVSYIFCWLHSLVHGTMMNYLTDKIGEILKQCNIHHYISPQIFWTYVTTFHVLV